jgi:hypothetical protein
VRESLLDHYHGDCVVVYQAFQLSGIHVLQGVKGHLIGHAGEVVTLLLGDELHISEDAHHTLDIIVFQLLEEVFNGVKLQDLVLNILLLRSGFN